MGKVVYWKDCTVAQEWLEAISPQNVLSTLHLAGGNIASHSSGTELPWTSHQFKNHMLFRDSGMRKPKVQGGPQIC